MLNMAVRQSTGLCSQNSVVWYILLSISFTSRELMATVCSDAVLKYNDSVLRMCESGNAVGKQIAVDTFDSALYGVGNCNCDINFMTNMTNMTTTVNLNSSIVNDLLPGAPCNSGVTLLYGNTFSTLYSCDNRKNFSEQLERNLSYRISWNHNTNTSKSGYCMQFESNSTDVSLNITCIQTDRLLNTELSSTVATEDGTTVTATKSGKKDILMTIIVPAVAAGAGFILVLTVIVLIVKCKRKKKAAPNEEREDRRSGIRANVLYISADEVDDIKQQDELTNNSFLTDQESKHDTLQNSEEQNEMELSKIDQPKGALYAVVNKKNKSESVKEGAPIAAPRKNNPDISGPDSLQNPKSQNEMKFQDPEQPQRALYAVVNKKNKSGTFKEETPRTMTYRNQDGLNYIQDEVNADSSPTSGAPSVRISSKKTEGDRVTYSEVKIAD